MLDAHYADLEQQDWAELATSTSPYSEAVVAGTLFDYSTVPIRKPPTSPKPGSALPWPATAAAALLKAMALSPRPLADCVAMMQMATHFKEPYWLRHSCSKAIFRRPLPTTTSRNPA
ncbi:hypothetical protein MyNCGM683_41280 [Achromobacter xylosoxidans]